MNNFKYNDIKKEDCYEDEFVKELSEEWACRLLLQGLVCQEVAGKMVEGPPNTAFGSSI